MDRKNDAPLLDSGMTREKVESVVFNTIKEIIAGGSFTSRFNKEWFEDLVTDVEPDKKLPPQEAVKLKTTFYIIHFSNKEIRKLAKEEDEDIPPY